MSSLRRTKIAEDRIVAKLDEVNTKLDEVSLKLDDVKAEVRNVGSEMRQVGDDLRNVGTKLDKLVKLGEMTVELLANGHQPTPRIDHTDHESRLILVPLITSVWWPGSN